MEFDAFSVNVTFSEIPLFSLISRRKNNFGERENDEIDENNKKKWNTFALSVRLGVEADNQ